MLLSCYDLVEFVEISRHCNTTGVWGIYFALVKSLHVAIGRLHVFLSNIILDCFGMLRVKCVMEMAHFELPIMKPIALVWVHVKPD